jgi:ABC-type molybdate transport system substrate-binding protein
MLRFYLAVAVCLALISTSSWTQEEAQPALLVAAAADLNPALHDIAQHYEKKTGIRIKLSFGASGALTQQIENGAPFDLFFSADMDYPKHLIADDQADAASLYQYSLGKLVLWVPSNSPLDLEHQCSAVLPDSSVKKIAIANPEHAPYGRAAVAALKHAWTLPPSVRPVRHGRERLAGSSVCRVRKRPSWICRLGARSVIGSEELREVLGSSCGLLSRARAGRGSAQQVTT